MTFLHVGAAILLTSLYTFTTIFISIFPWLGENAIGGYVATACYMSYLVLFGTCYLRAWLTEPGSPSAAWKVPPVYEADEGNEREGLLLDSGNEPYASVIHTTAVQDEGYYWPYCETCQVYKPIRTHHCRRCNQCTLKMDHHCAWVNNCIGFRNHKFFIQTLVLAWVGCILVITFSVLRTALHPFKIDSDDHDFVKEIIYVIIFGVSNICALTQLFSLSGMVIFHLYLVSHNMTHVEYICCKGMAASCRFNRGIMFNLRELFGKYFFLAFVPYYVPPDKLEGDNYSPLTGGPEVDEALIDEWRKRQKEKRCGGMGNLFTAPCQAFS